MRQDTQYSEGERELSRNTLNNLGINPYAVELLVGSYIKNIAPQPIYIDYYIDIEDKGVCHFLVELRKPGFLGKKTKPVGRLDDIALKMVMRSYFEALSPHPISFLYQGIEVHVRTPGVSDSDKKNVARNIFNPTKEKTPTKRKKKA